MNSIGPGIVAIVGGVITIAIVAVVVSRNAQTASVIQGGGTALASVIGAAVAPVSGGSTSNTFGSVGQTVGGVTA